MQMNLGIGVPFWNVARFIIFSIGLTTVLSKMWSLASARRAGGRLSQGLEIQLTPRPYTRSSLVTEFDAKDRSIRALLNIIALVLLASDLLIEFGSGSTEVPGNQKWHVGYKDAGVAHELEAVRDKQGTWFMVRERSEKYRFHLEVKKFERTSVDMPRFTEDDYFRLRTRQYDTKWQSIEDGSDGGWLKLMKTEQFVLAGSSAQVVERGGYYLYGNAFGDYIIGGAEGRPVPSWAFIDIVSEAEFGNWMPLMATSTGILIVDFLGTPHVQIPCGPGSSAPADWDTSCVPSSSRPWKLERHDMTGKGTSQNRVRAIPVQMDFGKATEETDGRQEANFNAIKVSSRFASGKSRSVLRGENITVILAGDWTITHQRQGEGSMFCLSVQQDPSNDGEPLCRVRNWGSRCEDDAAFMALQLAAYENTMIWDVYDSWLNNSGSQTADTLKWIDTKLCSREAYDADDVKVVATVNSSFLAGLILIFVSATVGFGLYWYHSYNLWLPYPSCKSVTLESTRRVAAMSGMTKYNCNMVPRTAPLTRIVKTGASALHLETSYGPRVDPDWQLTKADCADMLLL